MHLNNLKVPLDPRFDQHDEIFFVGRLRFPGSIDCTNGVTFLAFISESGLEELQIAVNDKENATFSRATRRDDKMKIKLEGRPDKDGKKFYVAKVQFNGSIMCNPELCFLVFISKEGSEELQITGKFTQCNSTPKIKEIEVIRR